MSGGTLPYPKPEMLFRLLTGNSCQHVIFPGRMAASQNPGVIPVRTTQRDKLISMYYVPDPIILE
ncbi:MAG: hypothetical protein LJE73_05895 [Proteobacteria bacterium]|jgi:hypothetical protein|nr:hypothetical protein [Pseudomonadota bacterium]